MFKVSNIRRMAIININCFKHFDMFVVEEMDDLRKLFVPRRTFSGIVLSLNGRVWEFLFFIDRQFAENFLFFYFSSFEKTLMRGI